MSLNGVECPLCKAWQPSWGDLVAHTESHTGKQCIGPNGLFYCPCCNFWSGVPLDMTNHFQELAGRGELLDHIIHAATMRALLGEE